MTRAHGVVGTLRLAGICLAVLSSGCGTPVVSPSPSPTASALAPLSDAARVWCSRNEPALDEAAAVLGLEALPAISRTVSYDAFTELVRSGTIISVFLGGPYIVGVETAGEGITNVEVIQLDPAEYWGERNLLADLSTAAKDAGTPDELFWLDAMPFAEYTEADYARACEAAFEARD